MASLSIWTCEEVQRYDPPVQFRTRTTLTKYTVDVNNMKIIMKKNKTAKKVQKTSDKSFEILELYEDEPIIFHNNSDKKQTTTTNTITSRPDKRKIMLVIPGR